MPKEIYDPSEYLEKGEPARLIPFVTESTKELGATSALLATLMAVDEFGKHMLSMVGGPSTKRTQVSCFTEVVFKNSSIQAKKGIRPDGLIVATTGKTEWWALVESKIGTNQLDADQIEKYLDLARENDLDALITISNQFAAAPDHHPVQISGHKTRSVSLHHWSWTSLVSEAKLLAENKGVSDPDQAYILQELIRYLGNDKSGVLEFKRMPSGWKSICAKALNNHAISKSDPEAVDVVAGWHQLVRYLSLDLSVAIGANASLNISRAHKSDPNKRLHDALDGLASDYLLEDVFSIPNTASDLTLSADVGKKVLSASMWLKAPKDRKRATACVTWLKNQLSMCEDGDIKIKTTFARRNSEKHSTLGEIRENPQVLLLDDLSILPRWFEIKRNVSNGSRFNGPQTFVKDARKLVLSFYEDVGQHLVEWKPPTPKMKPTAEDVIQKDEVKEKEKKGLGLGLRFF